MDVGSLDGKAWLLLGAHVAVGGLFVGFAVLGLLGGGGELAAVGVRFLIGVLVIALGFAVARLV